MFAINSVGVLAGRGSNSLATAQTPVPNQRNCDALCPISINTALSEKLQSAITGVIYNVSTKEALQVLCFGMH